MLSSSLALRGGGVRPSCVNPRRPLARASATPGPSEQTTALVKAPADFVAPTPRRFSIAEGQFLDIATAAAGSVFRGTSGLAVAGWTVSVVPDAEVPADAYAFTRGVAGRTPLEKSTVGSWPRPALPLTLYEFQGCPFCRRVREAAVYFDIDLLVFPCPRDGPTWRPKAVAEGGKAQFPYLVDPNTDTRIYESAAIAQHMATHYGDGVVPSALSSPVAPLLLGLSMLPRAGKGSKYRKSRVTAETQPLTLWAYETSPVSHLIAPSRLHCASRSHRSVLRAPSGATV